jgi:phosphohistidine phosphatase
VLAAAASMRDGMAWLFCEKSMSLTVSLLRHAKSSWDEPGQDDAERPLNARGRVAAPLIGAWMAESLVIPQHVLCSTAVRTRETLALMLPFFKLRPKVSYREELYLANANTILTQLRAASGSTQHVLVIGHNPGLEDLATELVGRGDPDAREALAQRFPTCGLAVLTFDAQSWSKVVRDQGKLLHFVTPRALA